MISRLMLPLKWDLLRSKHAIFICTRFVLWHAGLDWASRLKAWRIPEAKDIRRWDIVPAKSPLLPGSGGSQLIPDQLQHVGQPATLALLRYQPNIIRITTNSSMQISEGKKNTLVAPKVAPPIYFHGHKQASNCMRYLIKSKQCSGYTFHSSCKIKGFGRCWAGYGSAQKMEIGLAGRRK